MAKGRRLVAFDQKMSRPGEANGGVGAGGTFILMAGIVLYPPAGRPLQKRQSAKSICIECRSAIVSYSVLHGTDAPY